MEAGHFSVASVERRRAKRNPQPPFTTSSFQMDASRKLGLGAQAAMRVAQQLYEGVELGGETVGLISYMRTDGVQMAKEAITAIRSHVGEAYGPDYLPGAPREYSTKAKNAQEAHEAIRPTDVARTPAEMARYLNEEQRRVYELIWKRAVASQMQSAELDQVTVDVASGGTRLRATGSIVAFDGFLKLYREATDEAPEGDSRDESRMLPPMNERDPLRRDRVAAEQHFTQPPPRYSEASLVKRMEELGIGRPSTYASILSVLRDRNYVRMENRRFVPEDRGRLVTAFLTSFFERYVDTGFTAGLEEQLDEISDGRLDWRAVMERFWRDFSHAVEQTRELKISDVIDALDQDLGEHFFPAAENGADPRLCTSCGTGRLGLKLGRHGSFIGCSNYPECQYTRRLAIGADESDTLKEGMRELGHHPDTGGGHHRAPRPVWRVRAAGRARPGRQEGQAAPDVAAARDRGRHHHLGTGAGLAVAAARDRRPSGDRRADGGGDRAVRALCADGQHLCLARPRRRRARPSGSTGRWTRCRRSWRACARSGRTRRRARRWW